MTMPTRTQITWSQYSAGLRPENSHMDTSTRYPKKIETTYSRRRLILSVLSSLFQSMRAWRVTSRKLNRMVNIPRLSGKIMDRL